MGRLASILLVFFSVCIFLLPIFPLQAQQDYNSNIKQEEPRIKDVRLNLSKDLPPFPKNGLLLFYSRQSDANYLVFYDRDGQELYFRYREDRFDRDAEKKLPFLRKGQAYRLKSPGTLLGILLGPFFGPTASKKFFPVQQHKPHLSNTQATLVFQFEGATDTSLDQLLF